jgi:hypothetical protein
LFRSLFIGFLILSALTAKSAETQVAENINNTPANTLPGFFGTMPGQTEKTGGNNSAAAGSASFCQDIININEDVLLSGIANKGDVFEVFAWFKNNYWTDYQPVHAGVLPEQVCSSADEAFYCVSGLSPPCLAERL